MRNRQLQDGGYPFRLRKWIAASWRVFFFFFMFLGQGICVHAGEPVFEKDGEVYLIQSAEDMRTLALLVNGGKEVEPGVAAHSASYRLTCDIDISAFCTGEEGWEPIGYRDISDDSLKDMLWEEREEERDNGEIVTRYTSNQSRIIFCRMVIVYDQCFIIRNNAHVW